jgi:hypothetical protein
MRYSKVESFTGDFANCMEQTHSSAAVDIPVVRKPTASSYQATEFIIIIIIRGATGSDETWLAEQPPLAVFPDCTRPYWVDMWAAHRIPQLHFQLSKPDRYLFIQVTTQFIRSRSRPNSLRKILRSARESNLGPLCLYSATLTTRPQRRSPSSKININFGSKVTHPDNKLAHL